MNEVKLELQKKTKKKLVQYVKKMWNINHPITFTQLRLKVIEITQERITPFKNGIWRWGLLMWFGKCNPDLSLHVSYGSKIHHIFFWHYCTWNNLKWLWVSKKPFSKEAWMVLKMERVINILVFCKCFFRQMIKLFPLTIDKKL